MDYPTVCFVQTVRALHSGLRPDAECDEVMRILKGESGRSRSFKLRVKKRYRLSDDGLTVINLVTKKPLFRQSQLPEAIRQAHDLQGHPGRDTTLNNLRRAVGFAPKTEVQQYIRACTTCADKLRKPAD